MNDEVKDESEGDSGSIAELMGYDKWPRDVAIAFDRERGVASLKWIKNSEIDFASIVADYAAIEAKYVVLVGNNQENAQQVRRIMTQMLLQAAIDKDEPFESCQRHWNDLVQMGFYCIERQCDFTWLFADCCHEHGQFEIGVAVIDPLVVELERLRAEPTVTKQATKYYDQELGYLRKLRAKLEAQKNGEASDDE